MLVFLPLPAEPEAVPMEMIAPTRDVWLIRHSFSLRPPRRIYLPSPRPSRAPFRCYSSRLACGRKIWTETSSHFEVKQKSTETDGNRADEKLIALFRGNTRIEDRGVCERPRERREGKNECINWTVRRCFARGSGERGSYVPGMRIDTVGSACKIQYRRYWTSLDGTEDVT